MKKEPTFSDRVVELAISIPPGRVTTYGRIARDGRVWMNSEHEARRRRLYKKEGIVLDKTGRIQNFADVLLEF